MNISSLRKLTVLLAVASSIGSQGILRADLGDNNPSGVSGDFNGNVTTGCSYDPYTGSALRQITDIITPGAVGAYGLAFSRTMNSRSDLIGINFPFGKAAGWRHNYQWDIDPETVRNTSDPCHPIPAANQYVVRYPDGRKVKFVADGSNTWRSETHGIGDRFAPITVEEDDVSRCYLLLADGGKIRFKATLVAPPPPLCAMQIRPHIMTIPLNSFVRESLILMAAKHKLFVCPRKAFYKQSQLRNRLIAI